MTYYIKGGSRFNEANPKVWVLLNILGYDDDKYLDQDWKDIDYDFGGSGEVVDTLDPFWRLGGATGGEKEVMIGLWDDWRLRITEAGGLMQWNPDDSEWQALGGGGGADVVFKTINCPAGTDPVADAVDDTLNITATGDIIITGNAATDTVDFSVTKYTDNEVENVITAELVNGQSIDNRIDALLTANADGYQTQANVESIIDAEIVGGESIDNAIDALILAHNVADTHIAHSGITITAGVGLSGGGTIAANRTIDCDITQYTDGLAVTAMGVKGDANPLHHDRYTDALAKAAAIQAGAYDEATWNGNTMGATKDAIRDKIESMGGGVTDHGELDGLADDDHTQYHNNTRGDARYYTKTLLDGGQLDNRYFTETESDARFLGISAKAADSDKLDNINSASFLRSDASDEVSALIKFMDGVSLMFGDAGDFGIVHNGVDILFRGYKHGMSFELKGENIGGTLKDMIIADPDSSVELYEAGVKKFETKSDGINVIGDIYDDGVKHTGAPSVHHTKTVSSEILLASMGEKDHTSLTNVLTDQHHTKYTTEEAQDAVGNILDDGTIGEVVFTYDDVTPKISATVQDGEIDHNALANYAANRHFLQSEISITESQISDLDHDDPEAIHDNVANEVSVIAEKVTPVSADLLIIEDSAAGYVKKKVQITNLPAGAGDNLGNHSATQNLDMVDHAISDIKSIAFNDGDATITEVKDEDNMASNSATKICTQQSIKAFGDSKVSDAAYGAGWIGVTTIGAGKNTLYNKFQTIPAIYCRVYSGTYTGNNANNRQFILDAGVTMKSLIIHNITYDQSFFVDAGMVVWQSQAHYASSTTTNVNALKLISGGFEVNNNHGENRNNINGIVYTYTIWGVYI